MSAPEEANTEIDAAWALNDDALGLAASQRYEEARARYAELFSVVEGRPELEMRKNAVYALLGQAQALWAVGRSDDALAMYDATLDRIARDPASAERDVTVQALLGKIHCLWQLEHRPEALAVCDEVIARFGDGVADPEVRKIVAAVMHLRCKMLDESDQLRDAIRASDELIARFGEAPERLLRAHVALAIGVKGHALERLGKRRRALGVYRAGLHRFGDLDAFPEAAQALAYLRKRERALAR